MLRRGNSYTAAHYLRTVLARDERPRTMHAEAARTDPDQLPDTVSWLLECHEQRGAARAGVWTPAHRPGPRLPSRLRTHGRRRSPGRRTQPRPRPRRRRPRTVNALYQIWVYCPVAPTAGSEQKCAIIPAAFSTSSSDTGSIPHRSTAVDAYNLIIYSVAEHW